MHQQGYVEHKYVESTTVGIAYSTNTALYLESSEHFLF